MAKRKIHEGTGNYIPGPVHEKVKHLLTDEQTQTHRRELIFRAVIETIAQNPKNPDVIFTPRQLALIYRNYANTLLLADLDNQHIALHKNEKEWIGLKRTNEDISGEFSYALTRLVNKEDIEKLANAQVCFTDNFQAFRSQPTQNIRRCSSRGRLYGVESSLDGSHKFTFLIRRTDTLKTSTDALEILSLISVIELARRRMKTTPLKPKEITTKDGEKKKRTPYKDELSAATGRPWTKEEVKKWARGNGITIKGSELGIRDYQTAPAIEETVHYSVVEQIKAKLEEKGLSIPPAAILGNDFALPILAATGIFTPEDMEILQNDSKITDPLTALNGIIKPDKLLETQQDIVRRYGYLQFINRYSGTNETYIELKRKMQSVVGSLKTPLFSPMETALADPIDYYDFGNLEQTYIDQIPDETIRNLLQKAKEEKFKALNFAYPLGDNTYGLVKSLNEVLGIEHIGFFGKVGATIDYLDQGTLSGVTVGRLVLPENTIANEPGAVGEPFINHISPKDVIIIPASDGVEVILQVNGVLLQTIEDIKYLREKLLRGTIKIRDSDNNIIDPKKIRVLLDMESHHLYTACKELGILPFVIYYTSDNTKIPPSNPEQSHGETLVTSLGPRGSLAVCFSAATILYNLLK